MINEATAELVYLSEAAVLPNGIGDSGVFNFTVPENFTRIKYLIFDPSIQAILTFKSQKLNMNVLENFSTKTGDLGSPLLIGARAVENDALRIQWRIAKGAVATDTFVLTLGFAP